MSQQILERAALENRVRELEYQQIELENKRHWLEYMIDSARQYRDMMMMLQKKTPEQIAEEEAELFVNTVLRRDLM